MSFDMKKAKSVKEAMINDPKYKGLMEGIPEQKHGTCGGYTGAFCDRDGTDNITQSWLPSVDMMPQYVVDSVVVRRLVIFYLCRKYKEAFACLEENFSFLFEDKKRPICLEWYHATIRKIMMLVAKDPYRLRYYFSYEGDAKKKKRNRSKKMYLDPSKIDWIREYSKGF